MTLPARSIDDIGGECLRRETGVLVDPWSGKDPVYRQQFVDRFAAIRRMLSSNGVELVRKGGYPADPPSNSIILEAQVSPDISMLVRASGLSSYAVVQRKDNAEVVLDEFTLRDVLLIADRVFRRDASVRTEKGVLTRLAAATEIYRLHAFGMGPGK